MLHCGVPSLCGSCGFLFTQGLPTMSILENQISLYLSFNLFNLDLSFCYYLMHRRNVLGRISSNVYASILGTSICSTCRMSLAWCNSEIVCNYNGKICVSHAISVLRLFRPAETQIVREKVKYSEKALEKGNLEKLTETAKLLPIPAETVALTHDALPESVRVAKSLARPQRRCIYSTSTLPSLPLSSVDHK